jgi:hypothetical protein
VHGLLVGALDMYYLHYYLDLYHKQHVPIHYILIVGYDDEKRTVYVHDCSWKGTQEVLYEELEAALNVSVPGMSKKNTYRVFSFPQKVPTELEVAEKGLAHKAGRMLKPPVSLLGIPAMRKLAKEIISWKDIDCYKHMVTYAGLTPPLIATDLSHNDGLRFEQARVLKQMGQKYHRKEWTEASNLFVESGKLIIKLCEKALAYDGNGASEFLDQVADMEEKAYKLLL